MRPIDADELLKQQYRMGFGQVSVVSVGEIERAPTLTPPNKWVSVEERLPERGKLVIVCVGGEVTVDTRLMSKTGIIGDWAIHQSRADSITHWMHLPESPYSRPPEGEGNA